MIIREFDTKSIELKGKGYNYYFFEIIKMSASMVNKKPQIYLGVELASCVLISLRGATTKSNYKDRKMFIGSLHNRDFYVDLDLQSNIVNIGTREEYLIKERKEKLIKIKQS